MTEIFGWGGERQQQIPFGDDNKKGKDQDNSNSNGRSSSGMTTRKAKKRRS
jgi:hypothetical protein